MFNFEKIILGKSCQNFCFNWLYTRFTKAFQNLELGFLLRVQITRIITKPQFYNDRQNLVIQRYEILIYISISKSKLK